MLSLAIGLLIMTLFDSRITSCMCIVLLGVLISLAHFSDWSYLIPAWTIIFFCYYARDNTEMAVLFVFASIVLQTLIWLPQYKSFASFSFQFGTLFSLIPIMLYNGECDNFRLEKLNRWFFYMYYPLHIIGLLVIQNWIY